MSIPLATNMCLVAWDQLAPGIRMRAVDVILSDLHYWGGFQQNRKMIAVAEAFNLGIGMHSDREQSMHAGLAVSIGANRGAAGCVVQYASGYAVYAGADADSLPGVHYGCRGRKPRLCEHVRCGGGRRHRYQWQQR